MSDRASLLHQPRTFGPKVVLFCGGRDCTEESHGALIRVDILGLKVGSVVLHGGAKGADMLADEIARELAYERELHVVRVDALWHAYGKRAGPLRNEVMAWMLRPDYAFAYPTGGPGTRDMLERLKRLGIDTFVREVSRVA